MILQFGQDQARRLIEGAAFAAEEFMKDFGPMKTTRAFTAYRSNVLQSPCLAYGADPALFADVTN